MFFYPKCAANKTSDTHIQVKFVAGTVNLSEKHD
jgi:hypothetical protein